MKKELDLHDITFIDNEGIKININKNRDFTMISTNKNKNIIARFPDCNIEFFNEMLDYYNVEIEGIIKPRS